MKQKIIRSKSAGLSMIFGIAYLVYSFLYYYGDISSSYAYVSLGAQVARTLLLPHLLFALLAVCINAAGFIENKNRLLLAGALFYAAAIFLLPRTALYLLPELVLCLIAYFRMPEKYNVVDEIFS